MGWKPNPRGNEIGAIKLKEIYLCKKNDVWAICMNIKNKKREAMKFAPSNWKKSTCLRKMMFEQSVWISRTKRKTKITYNLQKAVKDFESHLISSQNKNPLLSKFRIIQITCKSKKDYKEFQDDYPSDKLAKRLLETLFYISIFPEKCENFHLRPCSSPDQFRSLAKM